MAAVSCAAVPTAWLDDSGLQGAGFGTVRFRTRDGHELTARVYRPRDFDPSRGPIWFVLHGASRDVERYVKAAAPVAERYGALVVAPHVTKEAYPKGSDYTLNESLYADVERLFDGVRGSLRGDQRGYYLFGHSAAKRHSGFDIAATDTLSSARIQEVRCASANAVSHCEPPRPG